MLVCTWYHILFAFPLLSKWCDWVWYHPSSTKLASFTPSREASNPPIPFIPFEVKAPHLTLSHHHYISPNKEIHSFMQPVKRKEIINIISALIVFETALCWRLIDRLCSFDVPVRRSEIFPPSTKWSTTVSERFGFWYTFAIHLNFRVWLEWLLEDERR